LGGSAVRSNTSAGRGEGRRLPPGRLARHFLALARRLGFEEMDVSADPYPEGFYVAMGAMRIAQVRRTRYQIARSRD
jgi:hypothetical protein